MLKALSKLVITLKSWASLVKHFQDTELLRDETLQSDEGLQLLTREYLQPTDSGFV